MLPFVLQHYEKNVTSDLAPFTERKDKQQKRFPFFGPIVNINTREDKKPE